MLLQARVCVDISEQRWRGAGGAMGLERRGPFTPYLSSGGKEGWCAGAESRACAFVGGVPVPPRPQAEAFQLPSARLIVSPGLIDSSKPHSNGSGHYVGYCMTMMKLSRLVKTKPLLSPFPSVCHPPVSATCSQRAPFHTHGKNPNLSQ